MRRLPSLLVEVANGGSWESSSEDGSVIIAEPGRVLVVPPDVPHRLVWRGAPGRTQWWMLGLSDGGRRHPLSELTRPWLPSEEASERVVETLRSASGGTQSLQERIRTSLTAMVVLEALLAELPPLARNTPVVDHRIKAVLEYIDSHLSQQLSRDELARVAHLSPTRFHYVFAESIGVPPLRYLMTRRLDRARELLGGTDEPIKQIADQVGFTGAERFSRAFHARVGISPTRYRALLRDRS